MVDGHHCAGPEARQNLRVAGVCGGGSCFSTAARKQTARIDQDPKIVFKGNPTRDLLLQLSEKHKCPFGYELVSRSTH